MPAGLKRYYGKGDLHFITVSCYPRVPLLKSARARKGKKNEKLDFFTRDRKAVNMHANPVIRGLVKHPKDWRWSSWGFYWGGRTELAAIDLE